MDLDATPGEKWARPIPGQSVGFEATSLRYRVAMSTQHIPGKVVLTE
jgi:hypothetical protein